MLIILSCSRIFMSRKLQVDSLMPDGESIFTVLLAILRKAEENIQEKKVRIITERKYIFSSAKVNHPSYHCVNVTFLF